MRVEEENLEKIIGSSKYLDKQPNQVYSKEELLKIRKEENKLDLGKNA